MAEITLVHFSAARAELARATKIDEVKEIRDKAEALRVYCRQAGESLEMQNQCAEIKLRAERRAGEILAELPKKRGSRPPDAGLQPATPSLDKLGIDKTESSRWQKLAAIPEEVFDRHVQNVKSDRAELTTAGLIRAAAKASESDPSVGSPAEPEPPVHPDQPIDGRKVPVADESLWPAFQDDTLRKIQADIAELQRRVKDAADSSMGVFLPVEDIDSHLNAARQGVKFSKPYAPCPSCKTGCKACRKQRWVPRLVWDGFPEELKGSL